MALEKLKQKNIRRKRQSDSESESESSDEEETISTIELLKETQKLRQRHHGITADQLAAGKEYKKERRTAADPLKLKTGGYVDMKALKRSAAEDLPEEIGTSFAAETNRRDEDADMLKYVEEELAKRKGIQQEEEGNLPQGNNIEGQLYELPDRLKEIAPNKKKVEDMLSNQMLSGIPEVDLGIEAKIRNIEKTEEAKQKLHQERLNKKDDVSVFVPTNMAVNFVQHNRYNIEDSSHKEKVPVIKKPKVEPLRVGDVQRMTTEPARPSTLADRPSTLSDRPKLSEPSKKNPDEKATDDYHFEKFRRQMRR